MAAPITPNMPNYDGEPILVWCSYTAGGATTAITFDLPTYAPKIDLRNAHPVLSMMSVSNEAGGAVGDREVWLPQNEMARGTAGDSTGEWMISDADTIGIYLTADKNGIIAVTYIPYGVQKA